MKQEIIEGNTRIAEFMEMWYDTPMGRGVGLYRKQTEQHIITTPENLEYHTSWDWLMPVVEKISEIAITPAPNYGGYRVEIISRGYVKIQGFPMMPIFRNVSIEGGLINAVFAAVVDFIKLYNQNLPQ